MENDEDYRAKVRSARAVQSAGRRREEIAGLGTDLSDAGGHQLGLNQKIRVRRVDIQPLDGEEVGADVQQRAERGDVEVLELNSQIVRVPRGGGRVPRWRVRRVFAGDLLPIEPGHKTVVVFQAESELGD